MLSIAIHAQDPIPIVVLDFEGYEGISQPESITLTNRLRNELFRFEKFKVLERGMMESILSEQDFQLTGCVSNECLAETGRLVGAQQAVGGSIGKVKNVYTISARIIDVATGELLQVADYDVTGDLSLVLTRGMARVAADLAGEDAPAEPKPEPEPVVKSARDAVRQLERILPHVPNNLAVGVDLRLFQTVGDRSRLEVYLEIERRQVTYERERGGYAAHLAGVVLIKQRGQIVHFREMAIDDVVDLLDNGPQGVIPKQATFSLTPGSYDIQVTVEDRQGNRFDSTLQVEVPAYQDRASPDD